MEDALTKEGKAEEKEVYWFAVGYISPRARAWIEREGGKVIDVSHEQAPPFFMVGIAHEKEGYWAWSKGERQYRSSIEFSNLGEIQMQHQLFQYRSTLHYAIEYCSVETVYLALWDETFNPETRETTPDEVEEAEREG